MLPTDGIVRATAADITAAAHTDLAKARAIYEWIVDNTFRNPKTRGCGMGDIRFMLESRDLGGKCADLNALYVGLARAAGLPARDAYGIRIARRNSGTRAWEPRPPRSPRRSTAAPKCISRVTAGRPSTPPMSGR
jgi:transglutaminase-like putative cysteine protease